MDPQPYPLQLGKVQAPIVSEDTLSRARLLDWLSAKTNARLVLVVADAGHGKTTLLADWSRRARTRTAWYRLDETDCDWTGFAHHLIAAGREIDPGFAPNTLSLLRESATGLADRATVVRSLQAEFGALRAPLVLILDDYHAVEDAPEIREIVRGLVLRGPDRLTVMLASRRRPALPLARLRALGEVAELTTEDLRFDRGEIERLFRDAYHDPLDPAILDQVAATTEGWAATLRLVEAAIHHRPRAEVSRVIRSLAERQGDLHDYLAEEVVGRLPSATAAFLERIALLDAVTPELAATAAEVDQDAVRHHFDRAGGSGLLSRPASLTDGGQVLHPLVRAFLIGRLRDAVGDDGMRAIHARIARAAPPGAWQVAAGHHGAAGEPDLVAATLAGAIGDILGQGAYRRADGLASVLPDSDRGAWYDIVQARRHAQDGDFEAASQAAARAVEAARSRQDGVAAPIAMLTLAGIAHFQGQDRTSLEHIRRLSRTTSDRETRELADALALIIETSVDGNLDACRAALLAVIERVKAAGHPHYEGIALLNLAWIERMRSDPSAALGAAKAAVLILGTAPPSFEVITAQAVLGWASLSLGQVAAGIAAIDQSLELAVGPFRFEALCEAADPIGELWDVERSGKLLEEALRYGPRNERENSYGRLFEAESLCREGDPAGAQRLLDQIRPGQLGAYPALEARRLVAAARIQLLHTGSPNADTIRAAASLASRQGAHAYGRTASLLEALGSGAAKASEIVTAVGHSDPALLSVNAEPILLRLADYPDSVVDLIEKEVALRPRRWLPALRRTSEASDPRARLRAAVLIEGHGETEDIARLRALSHELKGPQKSPELGKQLSRRLAARVFVEDQGRVVVNVGARVIQGAEIRRKALALLCYLLSRDGLAATRDQVLEAMWPELEPDLATNSLHQTVYFLRRVIEPGYSDDLTPGYLHQSSELVWLDPELVSSRSARCRALFNALPTVPTADQVDQIVDLYRGRFALDFMYEEWASPLRETLHARYRAILERAVVEDGDAGLVDRALRLAQHALAVDPEFDEVEHSLLKLYRVTGAHAAAAEQYGHYAAMLRDQLGVDPPALEDL